MPRHYALSIGLKSESSVGCRRSHVSQLAATKLAMCYNGAVQLLKLLSNKLLKTVCCIYIRISSNRLLWTANINKITYLL